MNIFGKGVAYALEQYLNNAIQEIGKVQDLRVYPEEKRISGTLLLNGETDPCSVDIRDYEIEYGPEHGYMIIRQLYTSKAWVNIIFRKYIGTLRIPVPKQAAHVAKLVM